MAKVEIEIDGWGDDGQMVVVCGNGLCFQNQPVMTALKPISPIPKPPHLKEGQRAVYMAVPGKEPDWVVREPRGMTGTQTVGISFITFFIMYLTSRWIERKYLSKWFSDSGVDES